MSFMEDLTNLANQALGTQGSNLAEAATIITNITSLPKLLAAKEEATRWSRNVSYAFTGGMDQSEAEAVAFASRGQEGPADALRHCFLAAMLARDIGYTDAMQVLVAHEMNAAWGTPASRMDLHNNAVGLEIGTRMKAASDVDLQVATMDAFLQGRLRVLDHNDGDKLVPTRSLTFGR